MVSCATTLIVTVAFSIYYTKLVAPGESVDFLWGLGMFISNLIVMAVSPVIGAMADDMGRKKLFLVGTYALCVLGTFALYLVMPGQVVLGLILFVVSNLGFSFGENLMAAFLPEISTPKNVGRISGFGWGLGYLGGLASLMLCRPLLADGFIEANLGGLQMVWVLTATFFLVSTLPTFAFLRERAPRGPRRKIGEYFKVTFGRLATTARFLGHFSDLARFLSVFFVFSCGLMTVVAFSAIYAERTVGFTPDDLIGLFISLLLGRRRLPLRHHPGPPRRAAYHPGHPGAVDRRLRRRLRRHHQGFLSHCGDGGGPRHRLAGSSGARGCLRRTSTARPWRASAGSGSQASFCCSAWCGAEVLRHESRRAPGAADRRTLRFEGSARAPGLRSSFVVPVPGIMSSPAGCAGSVSP